MPLLSIVAMLTVVASIVVAVLSKNAFHETTSAVLWCGGWIIYGTSVIANRISPQ